MQEQTSCRAAVPRALGALSTLVERPWPARTQRLVSTTARWHRVSPRADAPLFCCPPRPQGVDLHFAASEDLDTWRERELSQYDLLISVGHDECVPPPPPSPRPPHRTAFLNPVVLALFLKNTGL